MKRKLFVRISTVIVIAAISASLLLLGVAAAAPTGTFKAFTQNEYVDANIVKINEDGSITYSIDPESGSSLPDYSGVGCYGGDKEIPALPVVKTIEPGGLFDHTELIQNAIDQVSKLPKEERGAILMKAGVYVISASLRIRESGVVLRGEGQGVNGTTIYDSSKHQSTSLLISGNGSYCVVNGSESDITDIKIPFGTAKLHVAEGDVSKYSVGDTVLITITPNEDWIRALGVDNLSGSGIPWSADEYVMKYERRITAINGNEITLDTSAAMTVDVKYTSATIAKIEDSGRITESGVENIRFDSYYDKTVSNDENHGWKAVAVRNCRNCWVKDVTSLHYGYSCVAIGGGAINVTVDGCSSLAPVSQTTGGRKYSFCIEGGSYILMKNCYSSKGRHDFVVQARIAGPNVFYNCIVDDSHSVSEPHHRWGTGTLYDNVYQIGATRRGYFEAIMRGNSGTGHGWAGVNTVFWNCLSPGVLVRKPQTEQNFAIGAYGVYGGSVMGTSGYKNWFVAPDVTPEGYPALKSQSGSPLYGNGYVESFFNPVNPSSLYQAQLAYRLSNNATKIQSPISPLLNYPIYDQTTTGSDLQVSGIKDLAADKVIIYVDGVKAAELSTFEGTKFQTILTLVGGYHEVRASQIIAGVESAKTPIRVTYINNGDEFDKPVKDLNQVLAELGDKAAIAEREEQMQKYLSTSSSLLSSSERSYDQLISALLSLEDAIKNGDDDEIKKAKKVFDYLAPAVSKSAATSAENLQNAEKYGCTEAIIGEIRNNSSAVSALAKNVALIINRANREHENMQLAPYTYLEELENGGPIADYTPPGAGEGNEDPVPTPPGDEKDSGGYLVPILIGAVSAAVIAALIFLFIKKKRRA